MRNEKKTIAHQQSLFQEQLLEDIQRDNPQATLSSRDNTLAAIYPKTQLTQEDKRNHFLKQIKNI